MFIYDKKNYVTIWRDPATLKASKLQHRAREDKETKDLFASIAAHGVLEDILITSDRTIIFGHRRVAGALLAQHKTVPCRVRDDLVAKKVWHEEGASQKKHSGPDNLWAWLHGAKLPRAKEKQCQDLQDVVGGRNVLLGMFEVCERKPYPDLLRYVRKSFLLFAVALGSEANTLPDEKTAVFWLLSDAGSFDVLRKKKNITKATVKKWIREVKDWSGTE